MSPLAWPILRTRLAWRTIWRLYFWIACPCRRDPSGMSWHGDGEGGWWCDCCGRRERRAS